MGKSDVTTFAGSQMSKSRIQLAGQGKMSWISISLPSLPSRKLVGSCSHPKHTVVKFHHLPISCGYWTSSKPLTNAISILSRPFPLILNTPKRNHGGSRGFRLMGLGWSSEKSWEVEIWDLDLELKHVLTISNANKRNITCKNFIKSMSTTVMKAHASHCRTNWANGHCPGRLSIPSSLHQVWLRLLHLRPGLVNVL
jgi:hypothetical protein